MVSMSLKEFITEVYLKPLGLSYEEAANTCGIELAQFQKLMIGQLSMTPDIADSLQKGFGRSSASWVNLYNMNVADCTNSYNEDGGVLSDVQLNEIRRTSSASSTPDECFTNRLF